MLETRHLGARDVIVLIENLGYLASFSATLAICKEIPIGKLTRVVAFALQPIEAAIVVTHVDTLLPRVKLGKGGIIGPFHILIFIFVLILPFLDTPRTTSNLKGRYSRN